MKRIIFATNNADKVKEVKMLLSELDLEIVTMKEAGIILDIDENGKTFEENAIIKARAVMEYSGEPAMADDSGLEVDFLNKEPGIYSARFLGEDTSYDYKNKYILDKLQDVPDEKRIARFVCAMALVVPDGKVITRTAAVEGRIANESSGENGFGYDPIFYVPAFSKTTAEMSPEEKNKISHRGKAVTMIKEDLKELLIILNNGGKA